MRPFSSQLRRQRWRKPKTLKPKPPSWLSQDVKEPFVRSLINYLLVAWLLLRVFLLPGLTLQSVHKQGPKTRCLISQTIKSEELTAARPETSLPGWLNATLRASTYVTLYITRKLLNVFSHSLLVLLNAYGIV